MKKTLISVIVICFAMLMFTKVSAESLENHKKVLSATQNTILANVGEIIQLNDYVYQHNHNVTLSLDDVTLTLFSEDLVMQDQTIQVKKRGAHPFLLQYQSANIYVYIVAKEVHEQEYVLYEESFDGLPNGKLPNGYSIVSGSAGIQNEQLVVAGSGGAAIVTIPNYVRGFSNYIIETDITMMQADNDTRWASIMFRYSTENYYQMAIRKTASASNGVEFAKRVSGQWNVTNTAAFTENLASDRSYHLKIDVLDSTVKEYINDKLLIQHEQAFEYKRGLIGFQTNGATAHYDNIKITLPVEYLRSETFEFTAIPNIYEPETGIVNPATVLTPIHSVQQVEQYVKGARPATAILTVNHDMNVINTSHEVLRSLYEMLILLDGKMIPAIAVEEEELAVLVAQKLKLWGILDSFLISSKKEVILKARESYDMIRGVLDYSTKTEELTENALNTYRKEVNEAQSVAIILNQGHVNKKAVNYLQQRLVTVFAAAKADQSEHHYPVILSGVNGIVTSHVEAIFDIYRSITQPTHVREVFIIAHRGLHNGYHASVGPENSLEVGLEAYKRGAKIIEIDIHLTSDDKIVVMHDNTTNRTAEKSLTVSAQTLETLENIQLVDVSKTGETFYIPSFRKYLEAFQEKDAVLFVEIKPTNKHLLEKARDLIVEMNMESKVVFIAFAAQNIQDMQTVMPSMANGYLTGALLGAATPSQTMLNVLTSVVPLKSTLNPAYSPLTTEFVKMLTHRGITVWPWTVDDASSLEYYYNAGVGGITTNVLDFYKTSYLELAYETEHQIQMKNATGFQLQGALKMMNHETYRHVGKPVVLSNSAGAVFDDTGKIISVKQPGEVFVFVQGVTELPSGVSIYLTSDVIHITFESSSRPSILQNPWLYVGVVGMGALVAGGYVVLKKRKRKEG